MWTVYLVFQKIFKLWGTLGCERGPREKLCGCIISEWWNFFTDEFSFWRIFVLTSFRIFVTDFKLNFADETSYWRIFHTDEFSCRRFEMMFIKIRTPLFVLMNVQKCILSFFGDPGGTRKKFFILGVSAHVWLWSWYGYGPWSLRCRHAKIFFGSFLRN